MKKFISALILFCAATTWAQNTNPQPTFAQAVSSFNPSVWLRLNGASATSFFDSASGVTFAPTVTVGGITPVSAASTTNQVHIFNSGYSPQGALQSVSVYYPTAPVTGTQTLLTIGTMAAIGSCGVTNCYTQTDSFYVSPNSVAGWQTFTAGSGFTARNVPAGALFGVWQSSSYANGPGQANDNQENSFYASNNSAPGNGTYQVYPSPGWTVGVKAVVSSVATITPQQPGFDTSLANNFSVAIPYNGWIAAPNSTLGAYDWNMPWSVYVHIDQLTYDLAAGSGQSVTLVSKGNPGNIVGNPYWRLYINAGGLTPQICFADYGPIGFGPQSTTQSICTGGGSNAVIPGYGIDVTYTHAGTGWINDDGLYINGTLGGYMSGAVQYNNANNYGFGAVSLSITAGGGGYTHASFTSAGGGPHCVANGSLSISSGALSGIGYVARSSGCTGTPTITVTGDGTGGQVTAAAPLAGQTYNDVNAPVIVGSVSGLSSDANQAPIHFDEVALFPSNIGNIGATNIAYHTKYWQQILGSCNAQHPVNVIFDDDAADIDNEAAHTMMIGLAKAGCVRIVADIFEETFGSCNAMWTQQLQQAGLTNVPMGIVNSFSASGNGCNSGTELAMYNASTPTASSAYANSTSVLRQAFAKYSSQPIVYIAAGSLRGLEYLMQSPADGISTQTGMQMLAQNTANGGKILQQGWLNCSPSSAPATVPCSGSGSQPTPNGAYDSVAAKYVYQNIGSNALWFIPGTPQNTGGVVLSSRTANDPYYLFSVVNNDNRPGWDSMIVADAVTDRFYGGFTVGFSGGTGYATYTGIQQTGGGADCPTGIIGWLHATSGVPDEVMTLSGANANAPDGYGTYSGIGYGCTATPTLSLVSPAGTGVSLTPYLNSYCATLSDNGATGTGTTSASNDSTCGTGVRIVNFAGTAAFGGDAPIFSFFATSLIAPPPVPVPAYPY